MPGPVSLRRGQRRPGLALLIVTLLALIGPASRAAAPPADEPPPGSYLESCQNVAVIEGPRLRASCRAGSQTITSTIALPCTGSIDNLSGTLFCLPPPRGGAPSGTYALTCTDIEVQPNLLRASCATPNMGSRPTTLVLPCNGTVANWGGTLTCVAFPMTSSDARGLATRFAPILKFTADGDGYGYPMSANAFWSVWTTNGTANSGIDPNVFGIRQNVDPATLWLGTAPTYYSFRRFGRQVRITYWWFYGYNHPCWIDSDGSKHQGDWENVTVILREDLSGVAAVRYSQHTGSYLRIAGPRDAPCTPSGTGRCEGASGFPTEGGRPVVYVGRTAHGAYHDTYEGIEGAGSCAYYGDARAGNGPVLDASRSLVDLDGAAEPWLAADRIGGFTWGPGGINTHPTQQPPSASMAACEGSATWLVSHAGCYKSEALSGDDQASEDALKECRPGYSNAGLTCNKGIAPWDWHIYGRLNPGNFYRYNYRIPTVDAGLARRRGGEDEWALP